MTDEAKVLVERLRWGEWYFEDPFDGKAYASDDPLDAANLIETQAREIERLRGALEHNGIYGCGMLNQPAAMNGPEEVWLKSRIFEMERTARAALGESHD